MTRSLLSLAVVLAGLALLACGGRADGPTLSLPDRLVLNRPEGLVERNLTTGDERLLVPSPENTILSEPSVSPDGAQIAYAGLIGAVVLPGQPTDLGSDLYLADADGRHARMLVEHASPNEQLHAPVWLPDGDLLIHSQRFESRTLVTSIERVDTATGVRTVVLDNGFAPGASPDGTTFVFLRLELDLTVSLWTANIDGSGERRLLADSGLISFNDPRFSPDGRYVALGAAGQGEMLLAPGEPSVSLRGGGAAVYTANGLPEDIWLIDMQTGEARRLADLDLDQPSVGWSADGLRLFAIGDKGLYYIDPSSAGDAARLADGMYHGQLAWLGVNAQ